MPTQELGWARLILAIQSRRGIETTQLEVLTVGNTRELGVQGNVQVGKKGEPRTTSKGQGGLRTAGKGQGRHGMSYRAKQTGWAKAGWDEGGPSGKGLGQIGGQGPWAGRGQRAGPEAPAMGFCSFKKKL